MSKENNPSMHSSFLKESEFRVNSNSQELNNSEYSYLVVPKLEGGGKLFLKWNPEKNQVMPFRFLNINEYNNLADGLGVKKIFLKLNHDSAQVIVTKDGSYFINSCNHDHDHDQIDPNDFIVHGDELFLNSSDIIECGDDCKFEKDFIFDRRAMTIVKAIPKELIREENNSLKSNWIISKKEQPKVWKKVTKIIKTDNSDLNLSSNDAKDLEVKKSDKIIAWEKTESLDPIIKNTEESNNTSTTPVLTAIVAPSPVKTWATKTSDIEPKKFANESKKVKNNLNTVNSDANKSKGDGKLIWHLNMKAPGAKNMMNIKITPNDSSLNNVKNFTNNYISRAKREILKSPNKNIYLKQFQWNENKYREQISAEYNKAYLRGKLIDPDAKNRVLNIR